MAVKRELREQARKLRQQGMSIPKIAKVLGVAKGSVSVWVRNIELTEVQLEVLAQNRRQNIGQYMGSRANRERYKAQRLHYQELGREKAREGRPLHMAGCMLYWAEGAKKSNSIYFVNSDSNMMLFFMRFLREELHIPEELFVLRIYCHTQDIEEQHRIENYWLELLYLPETSLRKTVFKQGSDRSKKVLENGLGTITVHRVEYMQHIYGAIQEYAGFDNPAWLF